MDKISFTSLPRFQKKVDERLIRGRAVICPYRLYKMKKEGITQIIDLRNTSLTMPLEKFFCRLFGLKYVNQKFSHRSAKLPNKDFFERTNDLIIKNNGKTYMHCAYGFHRTGICVAFYERFHSAKPKQVILDNMINSGYFENSGAYKQNFQNWLKELTQKYFS